MRLGVHEAWGVIGPAAATKLPCEGVRVPVLAGADYRQYHAHLRKLQDAGLWVLPCFDDDGSVDGWVEEFAKWLDMAPHCAWIEVGNEPEWTDRDNLGRAWDVYLSKLMRAAPLVRATGRLVVLASAMTDHTDQYLAYMTEHNAWRLADIASLHPYGDTPSDVIHNVQRWRDAIPRSKALAITEYGWSTGFGQRDTEDRQADYLQAVVEGLRLAQEALDLRYLGWFCYRDRVAADYWSHTGLVRSDGTKKRAYWRLQQLSGR